MGRPIISGRLSFPGKQRGIVYGARHIFPNPKPGNITAETGGVRRHRTPSLLKPHAEPGKTGGILRQFDVGHARFERNFIPGIIGLAIEHLAVVTGDMTKGQVGGREVRAAIDLAGLNIVNIHTGLYIHGQRHARELMVLAGDVFNLHKGLPGYLTHRII